MIEEIWRDVVDYEGIYEVSNRGRVRSLDRVVKANDGVIYKRKGKYMKITINKYGYPTVRLSKDGSTNTKSVHRLVANSFLGESNLIVNHKDGIKNNNNLENLEFVTQKENMVHAVSNGLIRNFALENEKEIISDFLSGLGFREIKKKYNTSYSSIKRVLKSNEIDYLHYERRTFKHNLDENKMLEMYKSGSSYADIGRAFNVERDIIRSRMKKHFKRDGQIVRNN